MKKYHRVSRAITEYLSLRRDYMGKARSRGVVQSTTRETSIWSLRGKVLVIAEKPKAAKQIANALSVKARARVYREYGIPYYLIPVNGLKIYVASSAGHLFGLDTSVREYPVFTYEWKPLYMVEKKAGHTKKFLMLLEKLCRIVDVYVNACDYDIEGSVIGYLIIERYGDPRRSYRAKFSSLTTSELRKAFERLSSLDWNMVEAGLCRHELDWIWGINVSRALMDAVKTVSSRRVILSAGRVQTPTLKHVVDNMVSRNLFIPVPEYTVSVSIEVDGVKYTLEYHGDKLETRREAEEIASILKKTRWLRVASYREEKVSYRPPPPFNLGDLQEEAARIYGFSPYKTQSIAEQLYLNAYISYPRTNSQKLPRDLDYRSILDKIAGITQYNSLVRMLYRETKGMLKPVEGSKTDPAHPAIYPTGVKPSGLKSYEQKIYDLIVRRFLAVFAPPLQLSRTHIVFKPVKSVYGKKIEYVLNGQKIVYDGWLKYYPFYEFKETPVPRLREGDLVRIASVRVVRHYTKPPENLSRIKILRWMENVNIGTEATRARIIEVLFRRGYLESSGGKTIATDLGLAVIEVLDEFFKELTQVDLTRRFEEYMELIREGRLSREKVVMEARETLSRLLDKFRVYREDIGYKLSWRLGLLAPSRKCRLCNREVYKDELCRYHYMAYERLREAYKIWSVREGVSWREYLSSLKRLKSTGKWVRELIDIVDHLRCIQSDK